MKFLLSICLLYFFSLNTLPISAHIINKDTGKDNATGVLSVPQASASEATEGCSGGTNGLVTFFHNNSICYDPERTILDYRWIFEVEGDVNSAFNSFDWGSIPENVLSPDGKHIRSSDRDFQVVHRFMSAGTYTSVLMVINDNLIPESNIASLTTTVTQFSNIAPVADCAGPYIISEGEDLTLEGVVYDANEPCGDVVSSTWDLDNDGVYDDFAGESGTVPWSVIENLTLETNIDNEISFKAIDGKGESSIVNTTLKINLATGIDEMELNKKAILYPNPVRDILILKTDQPIKGEIELSIIDNEGKIIIVKTIKDNAQNISLDVSSLIRGTYFLKIRSSTFINRLSFIKI